MTVKEPIRLLTGDTFELLVEIDSLGACEISMVECDTITKMVKKYMEDNWATVVSRSLSISDIRAINGTIGKLERKLVCAQSRIRYLESEEYAANRPTSKRRISFLSKLLNRKEIP